MEYKREHRLFISKRDISNSGGSEKRMKNQPQQFVDQILFMTIVAIVLILSLYVFPLYKCIIVVESGLNRIFALLLCQLLSKSVFLSQRCGCGLGLNASPQEINPVMRSLRNRNWPCIVHTVV